MKALVLAVAVAAIPSVQTNSAAGVWTAEFNGKTFAKVELHADGATLAGHITESDVHLDDKGELQSADDLPADALPIFNVRQNGAAVLFSARDEDGPNDFDFRVRDDGRAELRLLLTDAQRAELPPMGLLWFSKPIVLTRQPH